MARIAVIGGEAPSYPPPMLTGLSAISVTAGQSVTVQGKHLRDGVVALASEDLTTELTATWVDEANVTVAVDAAASPGTWLVSLGHTDGQTSNLLPLEVTAP